MVFESVPIKQGLGLGKFISFGIWIVIISMFLINIVSGLVVLIFSEGHPWKPLADSTLGVTVAADSKVYKEVLLLTNQTLISQNSMVYTNDYINYLRRDIIMNVFLSLILIFVFYKFFCYIVDRNKQNPLSPFICAVFAIIFLAVLQVWYTYVMDKIFIIPYQGLWNFIIHIKDIVMFNAEEITETIVGAVS